MVNEFIIQQDLITNGKGSFGDRQAGQVINNDLEIVKLTTGASLGIITNNTQSSIINFGDDLDNTASQIIYDHSIDRFEIKIGGNQKLVIDSTSTTVTGNFIVNGTTTTVDSTNLGVADNIILLNKNETGAGVSLGAAGIEIDRGSLDNAGWYYNETNDWWGPTGPSGTFGPGIGATQTIGNIGTIDSTNANNILNLNSTGAVILPRGTNITGAGGRPSSPINGMIRYNNSDNIFEGYVNGVWKTIGTFALGSGFLPLSGGTLTGNLLISGTSQIFGNSINDPLAPAFSFDSDSNTGMFRVTADTIGLTAGGATRIQISPAKIDAFIDVDLNSNFLINPRTPTAGNHVGSRAYNDSRYVNITGDTLTGILTTTDILPDVNNTRNIGSTTFKYNTIYATTFNGTATSAQYADLAERYESDMVLSPGTVVIFGGKKEITLSEKEYDTSVAGVVSTNPGFLLNSQAGSDITHPYIAIAGRVPCKVIGKIKKGDLLTTSTLQGYAQKAVIDTFKKIGSVFAKALEDHNNDSTGIIEVMILHS